jgi:hypothetical protein
MDCYKKESKKAFEWRMENVKKISTKKLSAIV